MCLLLGLASAREKDDPGAGIIPAGAKKLNCKDEPQARRACRLRLCQRRMPATVAQ